MQSVNDAKGMTVGVVRDYASASILKTTQTSLKLTSSDVLKCSSKNCFQEELTFIAIEERYLHRTLKDMNLQHEDFKHVWLLNRYASYFALSKDTLDVEVERYQKACDTVRQSLEYQDLLDRYFE